MHLAIILLKRRRFSSPTFVRGQKPAVRLDVCVLVFLVVLIFVFLQVPVVEAVAGVLALSVADVVDLSAKQADAAGPGAAASHRRDEVELFQQLLQLLLH